MIDLQKMNLFLKRYLKFVPFYFAITSCVTLKKVDVDILQPAKVTISPYIKSVVFVDNSISHSDSLAVKVRTPYEQGIRYVNFIDTLSNMAIREAANELSQRHFFDTVYIDESTLKDSMNFNRKRFNSDYLKQVKQRYNAEALILLNSITAKPKITFEDDYDFYVTQEIEGNIYWQIYDLTSDTLIDTYNQKDTLYWETSTIYLQYPVKGLPLVHEAVFDVAGFLGFNYVDRIAPYWESESRYYYTYNTGDFFMAQNYVVNDDWANAEKVWFYIYQNYKGLKKARAAHNIAVSKEILGDSMESGRWAYESYSLYKKEVSKYNDEYLREKEYYKEIAQRYMEKKKLLKQLGGE